MKIADIVKIYQLQPDKKLGQNFIFNENILAKIVDQAIDFSGQNVIEIGPGPGGLTKQILCKNPKQLLALEMDARCLKALKLIEDSKFSVENIDATKFDFKNYSEEKYHVIANLPYNVATDIFFKLLHAKHKIYSMCLMFQKEVAERLIAEPKTKAYGKISVLTQAYCDADLAMILGPEHFYPAPKIDSAVVRIKPHNRNDHVDIDKLTKICNILFANRRKMINKAFKDLFQDPENVAEKVGIKLTMRAEELTVSQFCALTNEL